MATQALATTARWIAATRAAESRRPDRLFNDPWAAALAGAEGEAWLAARAAHPALGVIAIRARFFDDFLTRVTGEGGVRQVVLMAAGLDTRAFRLAWPAGTRLFEIDQAQVLEAKERTLAEAGAVAACERHAIGADLGAEWTESLLRHGFSTHQPACWLLEGFLFYLPDPEVHRILAALTPLSAGGSGLGFDIPNGVTLTHPWTRAWIEMQAEQGVPFLGTMDDPAAALSPLGWAATATQVGDRDANYGRWPHPPIPLDLPGMPRNWFVTARRD